MIPLGESRAKETSSAAEAAWETHCLPRERREYLLTLAAAAVVFPAYHVVDRLLEPALAQSFVKLRVIGTVVFLIALFAVRRARSVTAARVWFWGAVGCTGPMVAWILAQVGHYGAYLAGYSAFFWGTAVLSWPVRYSVSLFLWQMAWVVLAFVGFPGVRINADYVGAAFFLVTAAGLMTIAIYARRAAYRQAFLASHTLVERNGELVDTMTRLRHTQARLVAQEKLSALGRMLAGLSHEFNNPVNVLKNNLDPVAEHFRQLLEVLRLARSATAEDLAELRRAWEEREVEWRVTDLDDALESMHAAVAHIRQVHADLSAFTRGDAPDTTSADANEGLRATVALLTRRLPEEVKVALHLGEVPPLSCQPGQLNQVWLNLLQNALDAVGDAGTVMVRSSAIGGRIEVTVTDDGPGVDPAFRARLFEPFATTKDPGRGTGLGLATSYQIVQRHGGRLYLDDAHAPGARFVVELPVT
jgi:signal transduction histidine kinase